MAGKRWSVLFAVGGFLGGSLLFHACDQCVIGGEFVFFGRYRGTFFCGTTADRTKQGDGEQGDEKLPH